MSRGTFTSCTACVCARGGEGGGGNEKVRSMVRCHTHWHTQGLEGREEGGESRDGAGIHF